MSDPLAPNHGEGTTDRDVAAKVRAVIVSIGLVVLGIAASLVFGVAFTVPLLVFGVDVQSPVTFLALVAVGQLAFLAVGYWYVQGHGGVSVHRPDRREVIYAALGLVVALVGVTVLSVVLATLDVGPTGSAFDEPIAETPAVALGLAALSIVLVAPAEELLFRGAIQGRLRRSFGPLGAVAGSSLLFGSVHLANYSGSAAGVLAGAAIIAVTGTVLGAVYEWTRNLLVPIAVHASYNAVLLVITFLSVP